MDNILNSESNIIFQIHVCSGKLVCDKYSNTNSLAVVYGVIFMQDYTNIMNNDTNFLICVDKYTSIQVINMDTGEIWRWDPETADFFNGSILLYVLNDNYEWLIYKSPNLTRGFCLSTIPERHPAHPDKIVKRVDILNHFKAYKEMETLLDKFNQLNHWSSYKFIYDEYKNYSMKY